MEQRGKTDAGRDTGRPGTPEAGATDRSSLRGAVAIGLSRGDQEASSDARNNTPLATSTGSPSRRSGVRAILRAIGRGHGAADVIAFADADRNQARPRSHRLSSSSPRNPREEIWLQKRKSAQRRPGSPHRANSVLPHDADRRRSAACRASAPRRRRSHGSDARSWGVAPQDHNAAVGDVRHCPIPLNKSGLK